MPPRLTNQIAAAFRRLMLRKKLAKQKLAAASEERRPERPLLRLVPDTDGSPDDGTDKDRP
jgi:hypothetical protein